MKISRIASFIAVTALLAGGLIFAPAIETELNFDSASGSYSVKPADLSLVCPGPLFRTGGESGTNLSDVSRTGSAALEITASGSGVLERTAVEDSDVTSIELGESRIFSSASISDATTLTNLGVMDMDPQGSVVLTGITTQLAATASMRGLAAASCQQPSNDFLIVGGSTAAGREALLVLTNPSPIDATADLRIFTDLGESTVSGLAGISVPARTTAVLSLASFAPTAPALSVQVQSQGAKLAGWIQQRAVRGTAATGVDWISPAPGAGKNLVIPGLVIRGTKVINRVLQDDELADAGHTLRVFAPEGASITVQIVSSDPEVFGAVFTGQIGSGLVQDFNITELKDGNYSVFISSDKDVYAGLRVARGNSTGSPTLDFAWVSAAQEISTDRAVQVPKAGDAILILGNANSSEATVKLQNLVSGATQNILVPAQGTAAIAITEATKLAKASGVHAGIVVLIEGQISDLDVRDPKNLGSEVKVRFR